MRDEHHYEEVHLLAVTLEDDVAGAVGRSARKCLDRKFTSSMIFGWVFEIVVNVDLHR